MAVTAEDKKYLSAAGISQLQKATSDWEKANKAGDKAGMEAAQKLAASTRSSSNYQSSGSGGYTTNPDGTYKSHITSSTPSATVSQPVATPQQTDTTDYAAEIIKLLTSGGAVDYGQLNSLVSARDQKIQSNPTLYNQFESTQDILNRYLPLAQQNESLQNQLTNQQTKTQTDVDSLINLLTDLSSSSATTMDYNTALAQAQSQLNPSYENAATTLRESLNKDMEQRGIYNSPLASGIMTEKQGALSNEQQSAIAELATTLQQNNNELSLQERQNQLDSLNTLLSSLIGREYNVANLTGNYGGSTTLAGQQVANETQQTANDTAQTNANINAQNVSSVLSQIQLTGQVTTQAQADLLGVPIGTQSQAAKQAAAELNEQIREFNADIALQKQQIAASNSATAASNNAQKFSNAMTVWQTSGTAPSGILQQYGIAAGTPWSSEYLRSAQGQLEEMTAEQQRQEQQEEITLYNRATRFMNLYKIDRDTATTVLVIIDSSENDYNTALNKAKAQKSAITADGVSFNSVVNALKKYYNVSSVVSTGSGITYDPSTDPTILYGN